MIYPSPCINACRVENSGCKDCRRSLDEIAAWSSIEPVDQQDILRRCLARRQNEITTIAKDQIGRLISVKQPVQRIVSLVPSLSQTLFDLGLQEYVVGISSYCPSGTGSKRVVGGTKNPRLRSIRELSPDLILANKEENREEDIAQVSKEFPTWVSDANDIEASLRLIVHLGFLLRRFDEAIKFIETIEIAMAAVKGKFRGLSCAYLIWDKPLMAAGNQTLIHSILKHLGFHNMLDSIPRYPEISLNILQEACPSVLFLPDEPYSFSEAEAKSFSVLLPKTKVIRVEGRHFCWNGTAMHDGFQYFTTL